MFFACADACMNGAVCVRATTDGSASAICTPFLKGAATAFVPQGQFVSTLEANIFAKIDAIANVSITKVVTGSAVVTNSVAFTGADSNAASAEQTALYQMLASGQTTIFGTSFGSVVVSNITQGNATNPMDMERNVSQEAKTAIRRDAKTATRPCYLTNSDLRIRYTWFGLLLGFSYRLDSVRLKRALHRILEAYTSLAGRGCEAIEIPARLCFVVAGSAKTPKEDDDIKATLPVMEEAPPTFDACVDLGAYDVFCLTAQERAVATTCHCVQLLHIPGQCLDRLHGQILQSNAFKEAVPTPEVISKHDITSALVWMIKEAAAGNDLTKGLQNMAMNIMGLRTSGFSELKPDPYIGNALCIPLVQPPELMKLGMNSASDDIAISFDDTLAAAACAIRLGTQTFRKDINSNVKQLTARAQALPSTLKAWKQAAAKPEQNPVKTCSVVMSSWRNVFDKLDFGAGPPAVTVGGLAPHFLKFSLVTEGPGGDGVFCALTFHEEDFERLQASRLLHYVAPEAGFVQDSGQVDRQELHDSR
ncbi:MAG: hypothetical protein FRX49_07793 [Trebouxia sp. A1-2]|nr:MAG: hypothetical protein FRX49_07793 [Trebouxia sp. A1-2]